MKNFIFFSYFRDGQLEKPSSLIPKVYEKIRQGYYQVPSTCCLCPHSCVIFTKLDGHRVVAEADADLPSGVDQGDVDVVELALLLSSHHLNIDAPVHVLRPLTEKEELVIPRESVEKGSVNSSMEILARIS